MTSRRFLTLEQLEQCLEEVLSEDLSQEEPIDVVQLPPRLDELTDCEDIDDDILSEHEAPREVSGEVELQYTTITENEVPSEEMPPRKKSRTSNSFIVDNPVWKKMDAVYTQALCESDRCEVLKANLKNQFQNLDPHEIFEYFFDQSLVEKIAQESIRYAHQKNNHDYFVNPSCIRKFLGVLIFTCYHSLPQEKMYWSEDDDIDLRIIRNCMPRNRYLEIKRYLHFNNNDDIKETCDKTFKIKPLLDKLNHNFLKVKIFSKQLSIDEQMVRYYGGHFLKQFIRGKPIRFGLKQWVMACATTGYCYQMELYTGKKDPLEKDLTGLGEKVITSMVSFLEHPEDHVLFFDNFFSSFRLMSILAQMKVRATGTARANRLNKCPIKKDDLMKKENRGTYDYRFDKKNEILALTWKDNNCVKVLTNHQTIHPLVTVQRYNKAEKKKCDVQQPHVIAQYNKYMGGVDKLDWHVNKYNVKIRGKKWYFRLFTNAIDVAMFNAYVLHNMSHNRIPYLDFIRKVARKYLSLSSNISDPKLLGRPSRSLKETRIITGHILERTPNGKQSRCAVCKKNARKQCILCQRAMHMDCFTAYHESII